MKEKYSKIKGMVTQREIDKKIIDEMYKDGFLYAKFGEYFRRSHGYKIFKVPISADFVCPNWDGRISKEGCIFCPDFAKQFSHESLRRVMHKNLKEQIKEQILYHKSVGAGEKFLVYCAFGTETYASLDKLKAVYDQVLDHEDVVGLSIGTRPDCLPDEVLDLLEEYVDQGYEVWLEIGQQSCHYHTCEMVNRGHGFAELIDVMRRIRGRGILVSVFIILGLPYETPNEMIENARILSALGVDAIKIYPLLVMKRTRLLNYYNSGKYRPLSKLEYLSLVADFLENLSPYILIQRISKDAGVEEKVAPKWNTHRFLIGPEIEKILMLRGSRQGSKFKLGLDVEELKPLVRDTRMADLP